MFSLVQVTVSVWCCEYEHKPVVGGRSVDGTTLHNLRHIHALHIRLLRVSAPSQCQVNGSVVPVDHSGIVTMQGSKTTTDSQLAVPRNSN